MKAPLGVKTSQAPLIYSNCRNKLSSVPLHRRLTRAVTAHCVSAASSPMPAGRATPLRSRSRSSISSVDEASKIPFKVVVYGASEYVLDFMEEPMDNFTDVRFLEARLDVYTAELAHGMDAICLFVNDDCSAAVIEVLAAGGVNFIAMRCAGYDRVDLAAAAKHGIRVMRVPSYSPRSVAEMALTLMMASARNLHSAMQRVQIGNYSMNGIVGWQMSGKTYGIVGTGKIGLEFIKLLKGFGGRVLAYDLYPSQEAKDAGATYVELEELLKESDVVSLHTPLMPSTQHIMNAERLATMKPHAILINVSRGGLIDTKALVEALQEGHLGGVALDVYEKEESLFFEDMTRLSSKERMKIWDKEFANLKTLPNVMVTPHVAFLTHEALANIADTTVTNLKHAAVGSTLENEVVYQPPKVAA